MDDSDQSLLGANPTYTFNSPGIYEVMLTVWDAQGNSGTDVVLINVLDVTWPVANAGSDQIVDDNTLVFFDGSASFDNVGIVSYIWTFTDGNLQTLYGFNASYFFETPDVYVVTLTVMDSEANSSNDTVSIIVRDNTAPTIEVEDYATVVEDNPISFDASSSYDNMGIVDYYWSFGDGTSENATIPTITHIYNQPGVYNVELVVTDLTGNVNGTFISLVVYRDTDGDFVADYLDLDDDGDGMPDEWEIINELDPLDASDANLDSDGDGISNLEEYEIDKNPKAYDFSNELLAVVLVILIVFSMFAVGIFYIRIQTNN